VRLEFGKENTNTKQVKINLKKSLKQTRAKGAIQDTWGDTINTNTGAEHLGLD
jgi:hypothetical protein